ncbi:MAG: hypothetical protein A2Y10_14570 [Planctomycetes bacterium GWF2_41_51]|nr:MAG: hypothetical protein A2Y10_14570 [Planctomycetes bacterium GWF2_41_51]HBG25497.1 hypothetical protein [Phycisphaerales bacterium]
MARKAQVERNIGTLLATLFCFILQQTVFAGVAVSPLTQQIEVKPGKKANFTISLSNNQRNQNSSPCPVKIDILDFAVSDKGVLSFGPEHKHARTASSWITFDENQIVLQPGESRQVKGTITAPIDADGDYWASAMVSIGETKENEKGIKVQLRTATGLFIRVARRTHTERGNITDVNITMPTFDAGPNKKDLSEAELYKLNEKQSLKIETKLKNEGLISIPAVGKAIVYNEKMKKIATIPLYASRNNVLPGDSRWFTGIMSQPLPAGEYKLRTFFTSESNKRQIMKESEFTISDDLAKVWTKNIGSENNVTKLQFDPEKIELKLNPGRFTSANLQIKNQGLNTIAASCRIENSKYDWVNLKKTDFTLAPNSGSSIPCSVKVPSDAKAGTYDWMILIEMEQSGLESQSQKQAIQYRVPVSVVIDENSRTVTKN